MNFTERRTKIFDTMEVDSALILYSGIELHMSADAYLPFEENRNFFYLTGLRRDHMILLMKKDCKRREKHLFIEEADPTQERWFGRKSHCLRGTGRSPASRMFVSWIPLKEW